ncbi:MAG: hypothetical protein IJU12_03105, partial [Clostridia bacterium]|nr:hypothetical protein [Clostridia bacterium]
MKYLKLILLAALLLCLLTAAQADGTGISGSANQTAEFYVYAQSATSLTFSQDKGSILRSVGSKTSLYGGFDISWYPTGQPYAGQTATLDKASASIRLNGGGYYTVQVIPWSMERLKARDSYLGYPGAYTGWQTPAQWSLTNAGGARVSTAPLYTPATATPVPWWYAPTSTPVPWWYAPTSTPTPWWYAPTATPTPWWYRPTNTPTPWWYATATPQPSVKARIYVYYRLTDGSLITYKTQELTPGTHYIANDLNGSYFILASQPYQTVTVSASGVPSSPSVTFYFQYNSSGGAAVPTPTPTPAPTAVPRSAAVRIYYKLLSGATLSYETRVLYTGQHQISYDSRYSGIPGLTFVGPAVYQVSVSDQGVASVRELTFYFNQQAVATATPIPFYYYTATPAPYSLLNEAATNQTAIIGAQKIFPRPQPGKGKNTFNYEAAGQKVTVHSKAKSLQNDNTWWICFSGTLKCWG